MTNPELLELRAPDPRHDAEPTFDLCAKVFSRGWGYYDGLYYMKTQYIRNSHYDWQASRIGLLDEKVVTHWGVWGFDMRVEKADLRCGCIGAVATHADYRKMHLMSRTARDSLQAMRDLNYDVSILFGIPDYYHRFGYLRAWSSAAYTVSVGDMPHEKPGVRAAMFKIRHSDELAELCNRHYANITGAAVRPTYRGALRARGSIGYRWRDAQGRLAGYVGIKQNAHRLDVEEAVGDAETCLRVIGEHARALRCDEVRFVSLPWHTELATRLRRGNCRFEEKHMRNGGALIAMLNLRSALQKLEGVLSRRLAASPLAAWQGALLVADSNDRVALRIERGKVRVADPVATRHAIRMGDESGRYVIGSQEPDEIAQMHGTRFSGDGRALCRALFPDCKPMLPEWDHA